MIHDPVVVALLVYIAVLLTGVVLVAAFILLMLAKDQMP